MARRPVAYIRRSVARRNDPGDVSRQFQTEKVRALADGDAATLEIVDQDWGRSAAGDKTDKRLAFLALLASVERGEVSTLYAYSADRLARSVRWSAQLLDACEAAGTTIVTGEGRFAPGDDAARTMFHFQAMQNEGTLRQMTTKARSAVTARAARGDTLGRAPYGYTFGRDDSGRIIHVRDPQQPLEPVLEAFTEAGSFTGAAKLLNDRGIPAPRGGKWAGNVVGRIVRRERPGLVPRGRSEPRVAPRGAHRFSRLLRCSCGRVLTPRVNYTIKPDGRRYGPYVSYQCYEGRHDAAHPRPYMVVESAIIGWAMAEAARLRAPEAVQLAESNAARREELTAERTRLGWAVADGLLGRGDARGRADEISSELERLDARDEAVEIPAIDWTWPAPELNTVLRALWEHIELDASLRPVRAVWRVPEWRAED
jgi:DNA invertase Pin-like site-specific DNA recombinase